MMFSIIDGVSDSSILLLLVVIGVLLWIIKLASDLKASILQRSKSLDAKVSNLEGKAVSIRREVLDLHRTINQKLDKEEFERRIDGLIELVGKRKETEKKKDVH